MEMNMVSPNENTERELRTQQKIEFAIRFFTLGVVGFLIVTFCCLALIVELSYGEPFVMNPFLGIPLAFVGGLMILAGTGQWRRWAYMWVFLAVPIAALIWGLLSSLLLENQFLDQHGMDTRLLGMLVFGLPMVLSYAFVRRYYLRLDKEQMLNDHS
jgi:hypothetical protein